MADITSELFFIIISHANMDERAQDSEDTFMSHATITNSESVCEHLTQSKESPERLHSPSASRGRLRAVLTMLHAF